MLGKLGTRHFLNIAKINSQQEKPFCPNPKKWFPYAKSSPIRKNFVPHGDSLPAGPFFARLLASPTRSRREKEALLVGG